MGLILLILFTIGFLSVLFHLIGAAGKFFLLFILPLVIALIIGGLVCNSYGRGLGIFAAVGTFITICIIVKKDSKD